MIVRAPNFFRFNADGAQWNAGTGGSPTTCSAGARWTSSGTTTRSAGRRPPASSPSSARSAVRSQARVRAAGTTDFSSSSPRSIRRTRSTAPSGRSAAPPRCRRQGLRAENRRDQPQAAMGNLFFNTPGTFTTSVSVSPACTPAAAAPSPTSVADLRSSRRRGQDLEPAAPAQGPGERGRLGDLFLSTTGSTQRGLIPGLKPSRAIFGW